MKFLIINTDYVEFLRELYTKNPGLDRASYMEQMRIRNESLFGTADFYSSNLRLFGHEAWDIHANNEYLQKAWVREYTGAITDSRSGLYCPDVLEPLKQYAIKAAHRIPARYLRPCKRALWRFADPHPQWYYSILESQIRYYQPDIIWNHDFTLSTGFLRKMKTYTNLLIGQIAAPFPEGIDYNVYDLILSSLPNFVEYFRSLGVNSELQRLYFEPEVLAALPQETDTQIPVSFVGSISSAHDRRVKWLESVCRAISQHTKFGIWGTGMDTLPKNSPLRRVYQGPAWGKDMYSILKASKITLNNHIDIAGGDANNMRLYEATGVGTLLITDWKENLSEIFEPGKEVVTYHTPEECVEQISYYLENDREREAIARAGQERTLKEHTYYQRIKELSTIVEKYL